MRVEMAGEDVDDRWVLNASDRALSRAQHNNHIVDRIRLTHNLSQSLSICIRFTWVRNLPIPGGGGRGSGSSGTESSIERGLGFRGHRSPQKTTV